MNMKKTFGFKKLSALLVVLVLALSMASCDGSGSPAESNGGGGSSGGTSAGTSGGGDNNNGGGNNNDPVTPPINGGDNNNGETGPITPPVNGDQFLQPAERSAALRAEILRLNGLAPEMRETLGAPHGVWLQKNRELVGFVNDEIGTGMALRKTINFDANGVPQISLDDLEYHFGNPIPTLDYTVETLGNRVSGAIQGPNANGAALHERRGLLGSGMVNATHQGLLHTTWIQGQQIERL